MPPSVRGKKINPQRGTNIISYNSLLVKGFLLIFREKYELFGALGKECDADFTNLSQNHHLKCVI